MLWIPQQLVFRSETCLGSEGNWSNAFTPQWGLLHFVLSRRDKAQPQVHRHHVAHLGCRAGTAHTPVIFGPFRTGCCCVCQCYIWTALFLSCFRTSWLERPPDTGTAWLASHSASLRCLIQCSWMQTQALLAALAAAHIIKFTEFYVCLALRDYRYL